MNRRVIFYKNSSGPVKFEFRTQMIRCKTTICVKVLLSDDGSEDFYDGKSLADMIGQPA